MHTEQTRNYIVLIIVLILVLGGVYYKKNRETTPPNLPLSGEVNNVPPEEGLSASGGGNEGVQPKLTYEEDLQQGIEYEKKGELDKAINSYKKASEVSPKEYVPYSNAGSAYYSMQKFAEAEDHFLKAIELQPNNVSVYTKLYDLYYYGLNRDKEQMNAFFADATKNTDNDINIVKLYAMYLEEIKDYKSALSIWQSLLEFEPDNALYKVKVEALQKKIEANAQ